jgi:hypothetical protein
MLDTIKKYWEYVVAGVVGLFGLLFYLFQKKDGQVEALTAQVDLANTKKKADVLEAQINTLKADEKTSADQNAQLDKTLQQVQDKRTEISATQKAVTDPKAIADYWSKN